MQNLAGTKLILATHNPGKLQEFRRLLRPWEVTIVSAGELNLPEPEETGETFVENARIKAAFCCSETGLPALSDDSGLAVPALDGAPGVYSARWAGPEKDFYAAMERVRTELEVWKIPEDRWQAHFVCVLALAFPDGETHYFEGMVHGRLIFPPRGDKGFGYDPIFIPEGYNQTFGELEPEVKNAISHRARASERLIRECFTDVPPAQ